jgi:ribosomal protein S18 acetylase RimI-like enzyme
MKTAGVVNASPAAAIFEPVTRVVDFLQRHGFRATILRFWVFVRRIFSNRMVLFYVDVQQSEISSVSLPQLLTVQRKTSPAEMRSDDWEKIVNFWNPPTTRRNMLDRFRHGASLWLIRSADQLAGYGWTMTGQTIEPHYHPLGSNDVHLFDFLVFPEFRGRSLNPLLVDYILAQMVQEGRIRAFIEVREWNKPQLRSLGKTKFQLLGVARKKSFFGQAFVEWIPEERARMVDQAQNQSNRAGRKN